MTDDNIVIQNPLNDTIFLQNVEILTNRVHSFLIDIWNQDRSEIQLDVLQLRPDWTLAFWVSENEPANKPLGRKFNISHRSAYSLKINGNSIDIFSNQTTKVLTLFTRNVNRNYYLNIQNREGQKNFYFLKVNLLN